jgi:hypothetical protein
MRELERHRHLPDIDRLSTLAATILLSYALSHFISIPSTELALQLPGIYITLDVGLQTLVAFLVAALTASGAHWLLSSHPYLRRRNTLEHWLLPALTAWVLSLPLFQLPISLAWWLGFAAGGIALILVLIAEYIVVDAEDARRAPAAAGLTAVAFALYLVLGTTLRFSGLRLYLVLPAMALAAGLVSLRTLRLRLPGQWALMQAGVIALISTQFTAALYYWPVTPVTFGLALLGPVYALTNLAGNLAENDPPRQAIGEPLVVLLIIWGAAIWMS